MVEFEKRLPSFLRNITDGRAKKLNRRAYKGDLRAEYLRQKLDMHDIGVKNRGYRKQYPGSGMSGEWNDALDWNRADARRLTNIAGKIKPMSRRDALNSVRAAGGKFQNHKSKSWDRLKRQARKAKMRKGFDMTDGATLADRWGEVGDDLSKLSRALIRRARDTARKMSADDFTAYNRNSKKAKELRLSDPSNWKEIGDHAAMASDNRIHGRKFKLQEKLFGSKLDSIPTMTMGAGKRRRGMLKSADLSKLSSRLLRRAAQKAGKESDDFANTATHMRDTGGSPGRGIAFKPLGSKMFRDIDRLSTKRFLQSRRFSRGAGKAHSMGKSATGLSKLSSRLLRRAAQKAGKESDDFANTATHMRDTGGSPGRGIAFKPLGSKMFRDIDRLSTKRFLQSRRFSRGAGKAHSMGKSATGLSKLSSRLLRRAAQKAGKESDDFANTATHMRDTGGSPGRGIAFKPLGSKMFRDIDRLSTKRFLQSRRFSRGAGKAHSMGKSATGLSKLSSRLLRRAAQKAGKESDDFANTATHMRDTGGSPGRGIAFKPLGSKMFRDIDRLSTKRFLQSRRFSRGAGKAHSMGKSATGLSKLSVALLRRARDKSMGRAMKYGEHQGSARSFHGMRSMKFGTRANKLESGNLLDTERIVDGVVRRGVKEYRYAGKHKPLRKSAGGETLSERWGADNDITKASALRRILRSKKPLYEIGDKRLMDLAGNKRDTKNIGNDVASMMRGGAPKDMIERRIQSGRNVKILERGNRMSRKGAYEKDPVKRKRFMDLAAKYWKEAQA